MADTVNQPVKSRRDSFHERLKTKYPDRQFDDDEALFGQISDDYDEYDKQIAGYRENEEALSKMFNASPKAAALTMAFKDGDPLMKFVEIFGEDMLAAANDPEKKEELAKANNEYVTRVTENKKYEDEYNNNLEATIKNIEEFEQENGISPEETDNSILPAISQIFKDYLVGKISKETLAMVRNAINHDTDVAAAGEEGLLKGKNTKIRAKMKEHSPSENLPPHLGGGTGGGAAVPTQRKRSNPIFDLADQAK